MINTGKLAGRTIFITGASRGIGKAIALKAAQDGANIVIAAKTAQAHPKLPGTIYSAAEEVEAAGGKALPCIVDVRDEQQIITAVEGAVKKFGGIDILINNASAISLTGTLGTDMKRYDLMHNVNTRGTFLVSKVCLPYLQKSTKGQIVNISPPLNMNPTWFKDHVAYTMAKYGMSMCVLGMSEEFKEKGVAVNALWPKTAIHTAAIEMLTGPESGSFSRKADIMADAAYAMLSDSAFTTGKFLIDEEVLKAAGITDMTQYSVDPKTPMSDLMPDFFLDVDPQAIMAKHGGSTTQEAYSGAAKGAAGAGKVEKLFESIKANLSPALVEKTQATFQFELTGEEEGSWFIDLKSGGGSAGKGKVPNADAVLTMKVKDFFDLFAGKLKPAAAFMSGKLKISGNLQKAMKLEKLMGSLKSKL